MATTIQPELIPATDKNWKKEDVLAPVTPLSLMDKAIDRGISVEQLQILQDMHFKQLERDAELEFNAAMNSVQSEIGRVTPDLNNPQTSSKYASYKALDAVLRPVYTRHGLSLSFSEEDCPKPEHVRIICYVSKGLHTRIYRKDMPVVTKGIKGNEMMTLTHATASSDSYARRYLLKDIFNVAIGEGDTDGNSTLSKRKPDQEKEYQERCAHFSKCHNAEELKEHWMASRAWAREIKDETAVNDFDYLKEKRKKELAK